MNSIIEQTQTKEAFNAVSIAPIETDAALGMYSTSPFADDDDESLYPVVPNEEMGETSKHYDYTSTFFALLKNFFAERETVWVAANMSLYYEKGSPKKWRSPDILVAFGVEKKPRRVYRSWVDGVFPQVVFELASGATFESDIGKKFLEYNKLGAEEYYLLDPEREYLPQPLMAYHRKNNRLIEVEITDGKVFSPRLGLEIVDTGESFRLFNPATNSFLMTLDEANEEIARLRELLQQKQ